MEKAAIETNNTKLMQDIQNVDEQINLARSHCQTQNEEDKEEETLKFKGKKT